MAASHSTNTVIYAALAGNLLVAITKFVAASITGSSAMLSEGVHSLVDTGNQILLIYGIRRAARPADEDHPLGHGRELYFWSFIVALLIFSLGAGVSFYEGISHVLKPTPIENPHVNYIVLGLSALFEGASWFIAFRAFEPMRGSASHLEAVARSKDPTSFIVLFEDSAALAGIAIALLGTFGAAHFDAPVLDGVASIGIGCILAVTAIFLARESKSLLIGEPARRRVRDQLLAIAQAEPGILGASNLITVHLAPDQIVAALDLDFDDSLTSADVERTTANLEKKIREAQPDVIALFMKPVSGAGSEGGRVPATPGAGARPSQP